MSVAEASMERYADPTYVGAYLEAEWGDKLQDGGLLPAPPLDKLCKPCLSEFYREVAEFAQAVIGDTQINTVCDIGCSTGRFLYELFQSFPLMKDLIGVEPSPVFTDYARKFLLREGDAKLAWIPLPKSHVKPTYVKLNEKFFDSIEIEENQRNSLEIFTGLGESTPRPEKHFDVLFCLNVVDRHPNPKVLVEMLGGLLKEGGLFFLASPMDWDKRFTAPEQWVEDLSRLFNDNQWEKKDDTDVLYPFRFSNRHQTNYVSQVVCMTKR